MTTHIAYPDELLDDKKLNEFYYDVSLPILYHVVWFFSQILRLVTYGSFGDN